jgi:hypothetical protein
VPDANLKRGTFVPTLSKALDSIREAVHGALGTRTYRVYVVRRRWSEGRVGSGEPTDTRLELAPRPLVKRVNHDRLGPAGREREGDVTLTEVSLSYSFDELDPKTDKSSGEESFYVVRDVSGSGQLDGFYVVDGAPLPRRGDNKGDNCDWYVHLRRTSDAGPFDGTEQ